MSTGPSVDKSFNSVNDINIRRERAKEMAKFFVPDVIININENNLNANEIKDTNQSHKAIKSLPGDIFKTYVNLKRIDFSYNLINELSPNIFKGLKNLIFVNFSNNRIYSLDLNMFSDQTSDLEIDFSSNPIVEIPIGLINSETKQFNKRFKSICLQKCFDVNCDQNKFLNILKRPFDENVLKFCIKMGFSDRKIYNQTLTLSGMVTKLDILALFSDSKMFTEIENLIGSNKANLFNDNQNPFHFTSPYTVAILCQQKSKLLINFCFNVLNGYSAIKNKDFFFAIKYKDVFESLIEHKNETKALELFNYLKVAILDRINEENAVDILIFKRLKNYFLEISSFKEQLFSTLIYKFILSGWENLIEFILDDLKENGLDFLKIDQLLKTIEQKKDQENNSISNHKLNQHNILTVFGELGGLDWQNNDAVKTFFDKQYDKLPRFIFYFNLLVYLIFLILYSINIELFNTKDDLNLASKITSLIFSCYFFLSEIFQFVESVLSKSILQFLLNSKNILEFINSILCIVTLLLETSESKSALFSTSIVLSYYILLLRLDKIGEFGVYVEVFKNVVKRSLNIFFLIGLFLIGFLLAFRNRSGLIAYDQMENDDYISKFNNTFELTLYKLIAMTTGNIDADDMGLSALKRQSLMNYLIYLFYIVFMPILLVNILIGISIGEVENLLKDSQKTVLKNKVAYVMKYESFKRHCLRYKMLTPFRLFFKLESLSLKLNELKNKLVSRVSSKKNDGQRDLIEETKKLLKESNLKNFEKMVEKKFDLLEEKNQKSENKIDNLAETVENLVKKIDILVQNKNF